LAKTKCQVEVATFRTDGSYSDGRRPDWVVYATAEQDAQRRDFTINGLFYDPIAQRVIDFVGGQIDLGNRLLRAIGDPYARINEDKLRMLRAIRFAARFALELDPATRKAIEESASGIQRVSGERIGMELSKILEQPNRQWAWSELERCSLLAHIAPELLPVDQAELFLQLPDTHLELPVVLAALVHPLGRLRPPSDPEYPIPTQAWRTALEAIQRRWKLPNATIDSACVCVEASCALANPKPLDWSQAQAPPWLDRRVDALGSSPMPSAPMAGLRHPNLQRTSRSTDSPMESRTLDQRQRSDPSRAQARSCIRQTTIASQVDATRWTLDLRGHGA
jgi:tRNA nucleotidyltransferase/poly(A) polymerase